MDARALQITVMMSVLALGVGTASGQVAVPVSTDEVARAVTSYEHYSVFDDVRTTVQGGVVELTGKVTMAFKRTDLAQRVVVVAGVREVQNRIAVMPASRLDDDLRQRAARAIYTSPRFWGYAAMPNPPIHIVVEGGHVTLTGTVATEADRLLAASLASASGAASVRNQLEVDGDTEATPPAAR